MLWDVRIGRLRVECVRIIRCVEINLHGCSAVFCGGNGSGKTSLLESVYILARGRSFRGSRYGDIASLGSTRSRVDALLVAPGGERVAGLAYERVGGIGVRYRDGAVATETAEWVGNFPVRMIGEGASALVEGGPALRRRFLDLNLFHVEPQGRFVLERFRRALAQRNAWLRGGARGRRVWDLEFLSAGSELDDARVRLLARMEDEFRRASCAFPFLEGVGIRYRRGWSGRNGLAAALEHDRDAERAAGYTRVGPHRGDFDVVRGERVRAWSHGQAKVIAALLQVAFELVQKRRPGPGSVWLLDDISADLDPGSTKILTGVLRDIEAQCLFTCLGEAGSCDLDPDVIRFHVEQGKILPIA